MSMGTPDGMGGPVGIGGGMGGGTSGGTGGMQIDLNDGMGGAQVPSALPIQLQGVLHEHIWNSFQQKVNAALAEEKERMQAVSNQLIPCKIIACLGFAAPFLFNFIFIFAFAGFSEGGSMFTYIPFVFGGLFAAMMCCCGIQIYTAKQVAAIQMELAPRFEAASNEARQQNSNVSLEIKRERRMTGISRKGRAHYSEFVVLHIGVAGALGGGAGVGTPAITPIQVEMQQFGGNYGSNVNTMPPASTPGMFGGSPLLGSTTCPNCFAQVPPGAAFCNQCGNKM